MHSLVSSPALLVLTLTLAASSVAQVTPASTAAPKSRETMLATPSAPPDSARFRSYFQPLRTEHAVISPDGRMIAFSIREEDKLYVVTVDLEKPDIAQAKVLVADDATSTPGQMDFQFEPTPARIQWMRWVTSTRVVVQTNRVTDTVAGPSAQWISVPGMLLAFDFDGRNSRVLVTPKDLAETLLQVTPPGAINRFSVSRNDSSFNDRVNSADRPMKDDTTGGKFGVEIMGAPPSRVTGTEPPSLPTESERPGATPRSFLTLRLDPERPGNVHVLATGVTRSDGGRSLQLYSVDSTAGALKLITGDVARSDYDCLLDQQGLMRIVIPNSVLPSFPLSYNYLGRHAEAAGHPLARDFDLEAQKAFTLSPENYFGHRDLPLGFDHTGEVLFYASNRGRDTFGVYSRNLLTGARGNVAFENPGFDLIGAPADAFPPDTLVFDPHTQEIAGIRYDAAMRTAAWVNSEFRETQLTLERLLPGRAVDIIDWDRAGRRFIVMSQGPADAGAFYVYDREKSRLSEFARRAPWLDAAQTFATVPFRYSRKDGSPISGLVTVPTSARMKPFPMVIVCPDVPWQRVRSDFRADIQALTDMGFAVVQINGRGTWGFGVKHREALTQGYDSVQIEDVVTTIDELEKNFQVNRDRVALFGRGHGGFVALRALQEFPQRFRCAIAVDAPIDLDDWIKEQYWTGGAALPQLVRSAFGDSSRLQAAPLAKNPEGLRKPVLVMSYPGLENTLRRGQFLAAKALVAKAEKHADATFVQLPTDYARGLPRARADTFAKVEEFLNLNIYSYKVQPGEVREIKGPTGEQ